MSTPCLSSSDHVRDTGLYCTLCDLSFATTEQLRKHIDESDAHPMCMPCNRGFLNDNSFRLHYMYSPVHHYCNECGIHFDSKRAKTIHMQMAVRHHREYEPGDRETRPVGWEDALAREQEREENKEESFITSDTSTSSRIQFTQRLLRYKMKTTVPTKEPVRLSCPVCLNSSAKLSATRCGHVFCSGCIKHTFEQGQGCPSCRTQGSASQLRPLALAAH
ncbi:hypothetical protein CYLTODRAFT_103093 [Cylindrobasidium torrendii FP15055 ss-10]|uniref:RING-type domain-containing protein n=1 Tax=Cylindrobasidium torrendii FP15055 ss-10 TaxID=1314674 RepID=A0A0D7BNC8_9AGAR|nr:hypothetical protein CYLTODRAFT_103093 [Cylindrobasidium torrendii FP15055 ss-10]